MKKPSPVHETCREWIEEPWYNRCGHPAAVILWGKLFPPDAVGPRCLPHAQDHLQGRTVDEALREGWAIFDLRGLRRE